MFFQSVHFKLFLQPTLELARALLGHLLVKESERGVTAGWIVETEAYIGPGDRAAHSYGGRRTPRTEVMFGRPGYAYVYEMHTHSLVNVVSGEADAPEAILIRAIEPYLGIDLMCERRGAVKREADLTNGPGKLAKAMGISKEDYGRSLREPPLYIAEASLSVTAIEAGPRIGIAKSGEAVDYPWRFWVSGNRYVSR